MIQVTRDVRNLFGAARDQGARPTCLAFATSDVHAALRPAWTPLSCEFAFYHAQRRAGRPFTSGTQLGAMLDAIRGDGQPEEAEWPYLAALPANLSAYAPPSALTVFRRGGEARPTGFDEILRALDAGRPPLVLMMLSDAFYRPGADGVVIAPAGEVPDPMRRHALVAVAHGTRGSERYILVRNSWGVGWGAAGHAWLSENYVVPGLMQVAILMEEIDVSRPNLAA